MKHISEFTSAPVIGSVVHGISRGFSTREYLLYETEWSGIYEGIRDSEWVEDGAGRVYCFRDGIIGTTPQKCFAMPVSHFFVTKAHLFKQHDRYLEVGGRFEFERWLRFCFAEYGTRDETAFVFDTHDCDNPDDWTINGKRLRSFGHDDALAIDGTRFVRVGGGFGAETLWKEDTR